MILVRNHISCCVAEVVVPETRVTAMHALLVPVNSATHLVHGRSVPLQSYLKVQFVGIDTLHDVGTECSQELAVFHCSL